MYYINGTRCEHPPTVTRKDADISKYMKKLCEYIIENSEICDSAIILNGAIIIRRYPLTRDQIDEKMSSCKVSETNYSIEDKLFRSHEEAMNYINQHYCCLVLTYNKSGGYATDPIGYPTIVDKTKNSAYIECGQCPKFITCTHATMYAHYYEYDTGVCSTSGPGACGNPGPRGIPIEEWKGDK